MSLSLPTRPDAWTVDDLWALPPVEPACRLELQDGSPVVTPLTLSAFVLDGHTYAELGTWHGTETASIVAPVDVSVDLGALAWTPRI